MHFLSLGYHACVLQYSVSPEAFYPTQLLEVTESVRQIHEHAKEWYIDTKKIVLAGASAGGHLAANYCAFWKREFLVEKSGMQREMLKPRGLILCYPVITSDPKYAHTPSFQNLLGDTVEEEAWNLSLDHQITDSMPPCFICIQQQIRQYRCRILCCLPWHYGKQEFRWSCMCIRKGFMDSALPMNW